MFIIKGMAQGPILIFDKSTLESLSPDEAVWLDNFFRTNITPLFFVETLADLEKQMRSGRTSEQVVGNLAYKTPDMQSSANVHHARLLEAELYAGETIVMDGRPIIAPGQAVMLGGKTGIVFKEPPEEEALRRWQQHEFLEIERMFAKKWRRMLSVANFEEAYKIFRKWIPRGEKPRTLLGVKQVVESHIGRLDQAACLKFGMVVLGVPPEAQEHVLTRWEGVAKPALREFAPYFRYVFSLDFFFYMAIACDLISRDRPSNMVDLAYLYYLPFCNIFTSNDGLHRRIVPLFLRDDQSFVPGVELKAGLASLDRHYATLPEEVREQGMMHFADRPPLSSSFFVTTLWDKHLPAWRQHENQPKAPMSKAQERALLELANRVATAGAPLGPEVRVNIDQADYVQMTRHVYPQKGKWKRFPPHLTRKNRNTE